MAQTLPVLKLATLLVRTLAKPVSKRITKDFSRMEWSRSVLVGIGQISHQVTSRMTIWSSGYSVRSVPRMDNDKAMKAGSDFLGESLILFVSGSTVVFEYNRNKNKEREKEQARIQAAKAERRELQAALQELTLRVASLEQSQKQTPPSSESKRWWSL